MSLRPLCVLALPLALSSLACDGGDTSPPDGARAATPTAAVDAPAAAEGPADAPTGTTEASGGVSLDVANKCSDPVDYCVVHDGVEKRTRLNGSSHEAFDVGEGATIRKDDGGSCGEVLYTASAEPSQSFALCE